MYGIALQYGDHGEIRIVPVLGANRNSTLEVSWPMAAPYALHLKRNYLLRTPTSKHPIGLWRAADVSFGWRIWWEIMGPSMKKPLHVLGASAIPDRWEPLKKK